MAKSKLIARRKNSTILVSERTLQDAIRRANATVEAMMESDPNDPRIEEIERAVQHMSRVLKATPQQMRTDGVASISDYGDDAKMPAEARKLKGEVDMIAKAHNEIRGQAAPARQQEVGYVPDTAVTESGIHASVKQADGGASFVTDRDEKAEAKAPERLEVPRLAGRKKKEAEDEVPEAPVAVPAPEAAAPAPAAAPSGGNAIDYIPTETLIKVIGDLPKEEDFPQNKGKQDAVIQLTEILKQRPVLPPEQPEAPAGEAASTAPALAAPAAEPAAAPAPVSASAKKADLGDHAMGKGDTIGNGSGASAEVGSGGNTKQQQYSPETSKPEKAEIGYGGLNIASAEKTADDYRLQDYKVTEEGIRPSGGMPSMDEQESGRFSEQFPENEQFGQTMEASAKVAQPGEFGGKKAPEFGSKEREEKKSSVENPHAMAWRASLQKEAVSPPGWSGTVEHMKKHHDIDNPWALSWYMKGEGYHPHYKETSDKNASDESVDHVAALAEWKQAQADMNKAFGIVGSIMAIAAQDFNEKIASFGGGWFTSYKPLEIDEDGGRLPEVAEAHAGLEDHANIQSIPDTTMPIKLNEQSIKTGKLAADMTTGKAVREAAKCGEDLKKMYLDAKSLTNVNDTRPVREAVEAIFRAADMFDEAVKALSKQQSQEESEAAAAEIKAKNKKSSLGGLALAAAE